MITPEDITMSSASIDKEDLRVLFRVLDGRKIDTVIEIGTWRGYSAELWHKAFEPSILITMDHGNPNSFGGPVVEVPGATYIWNIESGSAEAVASVKNLLAQKSRMIDFLFIDGGHELPTVIKDWQLYSPLVAPGGVVVFHDVSLLPGQNETVMVKPLWDGLKLLYPYVEIKSSMQSSGMGVLFV